MKKILFAGGGTGGHVYPAVALADEFVRRGDSVHFVGTKNHVEAKIVPNSGHNISFIWISGFQRSFTLKNILFPLKLVVSLFQSFLILQKFKPDLVVGTGGYVSGPLLYMAHLLGKNTLIQEQNSYPGVTTKLLHSKVNQVHIAYDGAKKYLTKAKSIVNSGNPTRSIDTEINRGNILKSFGFEDRITVSIIGGSLGAKSINTALSELCNEKQIDDINIVWQTGQLTYETFKKHSSDNIKVAPFYSNMNEIYSITDIIICRAGAMTLAEVQNCNVPAIIIPYKYATGNHQYFNAKSLEDGNAAILIKDDANLSKNIKEALFGLISDTQKRTGMKKNMECFSKPDATSDIVDSAYELLKNR